MNHYIRSAHPEDASVLAEMVGELLNEIMQAIHVQAFHFNHAETSHRVREFLEQRKYHVFIARDSASHHELGFIAMYESYALYAEGAFGAIPELYVKPEFRSCGIGKRLLEEAKAYAKNRGWKRLEVTTPPLPEFEKTLKFYEQEGFSITGGRKLKCAI